MPAASQDESSSLLSSPPGEDVSSSKPNEGSAMRNFIGLCVAWGVSHSCMTVGIAYASSVFDLKLGSVSTGLVYSMYTLTSLLVAAPLVEFIGPKAGMTGAIVGFMVYLVCFVVGQAADDSNYSLEYTIVTMGSIVGGFAAGIGWVSQGVYYARSAVLYSRATGISREAANEHLAGRFTTIYLGSQCVMYGLSAMLLQDTAMTDDDLFITLSIIIFFSLVYWVCFCGDAPADPDEHSTIAATSTSVLSRALATTEFTFCNRRAVPLMPITVTFGAACIFWASYVNDETVDTYMSTDDVGYLGSLLTGVVALCAIPAATFSTAYGKMWVLALGSLAYFLLSGAYVVWTNEELGHWSSMAPLAILYGLGRLTFENSVKAIYADMFPNKRATAFASLNFMSGFSSSIFAYMLAGGVDNGHFLGVCVMVPALFIVPGYLVAAAADKRENPSL